MNLIVPYADSEQIVAATYIRNMEESLTKYERLAYMHDVFSDLRYNSYILEVVS